MKYLLISIITLLIGSPVTAQTYDDYIGAGHNENITVTSSSDFSGASGSRTLDGSGFLYEDLMASRFLGQATLGFDEQDIEQVMEVGYEQWIDDQIALPISQTLPILNDIWEVIYDAEIASGVPEEDIFGPTRIHFNYAWWQNLMDKPDLLRQRVAFALSEILVVSNESDIGNYAWAGSYYYDRFLNEAFGNYKDLLRNVSLDPNMGVYLSHLNNPKTDTIENIHPDENYAREIMQLFSIGLYKLNMDGTRQIDANGDNIPTYNNEDIKGMAKVFTGLGAGGIEESVEWTTEPYFNLGYYGTDKKVPMIMYEEEHEQGEKVLFDGNVIPAGQTGMEDVDQAIDILFNHQNVPPFIARRLIQRLIKSNPSPAYIERVANTFVDNGQGQRGDLEAVIKAILLDEEARDPAYVNQPSNGRLQEPIVRYTNFVKAIPSDSPSGRFWNQGYNFMNNMGQYPMASPSVFNFFLPDHQPNGAITANGWFAPEFQIHNTKTILNFYDYVYAMNIWNYSCYSWEDDDLLDTDVELVTDKLEELADQPEVMLNKLDMLFTHGTLTDRTKDVILEAVKSVDDTNFNEDEIAFYKARLALYLFLTCPDYAIQK